MGLPRSTYYDAPVATADEAEIVARIEAICEEFEAYGYRRVGAALRHQGIIVNSKKVRRLMREHDLQPRRRKRFVATTDSDHDGPIFPNLAKDVTADGPNQLSGRFPRSDLTRTAIDASRLIGPAVLGWLDPHSDRPRCHSPDMSATRGRMVDAARRGPPRSNGRFERRYGETRASIDRLIGIAHDPARPGIEDDRDIDEADSDRDVGDVGDPTTG